MRGERRGRRLEERGEGKNLLTLEDRELRGESLWPQIDS